MGIVTKLALVPLMVGMTTAAWAADADSVRDRVQLLESSATIRVLDGMAQADLDRLDDILTRAQRIVDGGGGDGGGGGRQDRYSGVCHIDDDTDFDPGQVVIGEIRGSTVGQLSADCAALAQARFGATSSSSVMDVRYIGEPSPRDRWAAICHIDDDPDYDSGQVVIGEMRGEDVRALAADCASIATARWGANGSSGLEDLRFVSTRQPNDRFKGVCHVDDDPDFDEGQFVIGEIFARTVQQLTDDCAEVAKAKFGANGSSGIVGIGPAN